MISQGRVAKARPFFLIFGIALIAALAFVGTQGRKTGPAGRSFLKSDLAKNLKGARNPSDFPAHLDLGVGRDKTRLEIEYGIDWELQSEMETLFSRYRPDYGAFAAVDARTGRVLSLVSYSDRGMKDENLALRATFPSASVFKVVTAAAAIAERNYSPHTIIPFNGRNHTLYRGNLFREKYNRWTRYATLKEAFAKSINTVFGKIGVFTVGPESLKLYADRFGFNRKIAADLPVQQGHALIPDEDPWALAEAASGFTQDNTMSPLQGALIAAAVVNDGIMMEPFVIRNLKDSQGNVVYEAEPKVSTRAVDPDTAAEIRAMMRETIVRGTSASQFKSFFKREFSFMNVGGKTGSLTGTDPRGKYDWFVGFAEGGASRIAFAVLTVHKEFWRVKSAYLARQAIEHYYRPRLRSPVLSSAPLISSKSIQSPLEAERSVQ